MPYETIEIRREGHLGWIVLNRPHVRNAFSARSFDDIRSATEELSLDRAIRVIAFIGNGDHFSSGRDFRDTDVPPDFEARRDSAFSAVEYCSKPTIAAVAGYAITGGLTLAISCDLIVAAEDAQFQDTHAKIGAMTLRASRLCESLGPRRAKEFLYTCRRFGAAEALACGLVNRVVPRPDLERSVCALASEIATQDMDAIMAIKAVVNEVVRKDSRAVLVLEQEAKRRFNTSKIAEAEAMARGRHGLSAPKRP